jgi:transmembrane sensor
MPTWDEFERGLEAANRETAHLRMPEAAGRRVWSRLADARTDEQDPGRSRSMRRFAACAAAALAFAAVVLLWHSHRAEPRRLAGWLVTESSADAGVTVGEDGLIEIRSGSCTLTDEAWGGSLRPEGNTRLKREGEAIRIVSGRVLVSVSHRAPGARAAEVVVSGGTIQVLGTRFTVTQGNGSGRVTLHEGRIRFLPADRGEAPTNLAPGESLNWPVRSAPRAPAPAGTAPDAANSAPEPVASEQTKMHQRAPAPASSASARPIEPLLERVAVLRSRGQYRQAAEELAKAMPPAGTPGAESASYELGSILTYQLGDRERGCAHWRRHEHQFPGGTFAAEVQRAQQKLGCTTTTNKEHP